MILGKAVIAIINVADGIKRNIKFQWSDNTELQFLAPADWEYLCWIVGKVGRGTAGVVAWKTLRNTRLHDLCDLWLTRIWTSTVFYFAALGFNNCNPFPFVFLPIVEEPLLSKLTVSNATSDSMSLTWEAQDNAFDHFILEVRNSDFPLDSLVHTVPGASRRYVVTSLKAATNYTVQLHGVIDGQGGQTLTALATTGISLFHLPGLLFSLLAFAVHRTALKHGSNSSSSLW